MLPKPMLPGSGMRTASGSSSSSNGGIVFENAMLLPGAPPQRSLQLAAVRIMRAQSGAWDLQSLGSWLPGAARGAAGAIASSARSFSLGPIAEAAGAWRAGLLGGVGSSRGTSSRSGSSGRSSSSGLGAARTWDVIVFALRLEPGADQILQLPAVASLARAAASAGIPVLPVLLCGPNAGSSEPGAPRHAYETVRALASALNVPAASVYELELPLVLSEACGNPPALEQLPVSQQVKLAKAVEALRGEVRVLLARRLGNSAGSSRNGGGSSSSSSSSSGGGSRSSSSGCGGVGSGQPTAPVLLRARL